MSTDLTNFPYSFDTVIHNVTDVKHLEIVTPKEMRLKIINTTNENVTLGLKNTILQMLFHPQTRTAYLNALVSSFIPSFFL
jgi:hypothetical protein